MKFAVSTLALPDFGHLPLLPRLRLFGFGGVEIMPERAWPEAAPTAREVASYRYAVTDAGLEVIGLDGLLDGDAELGILAGGEAAERTIVRLVKMSALCRDLGGKTLVLGQPRWRNGLDLTAAWTRCRLFLDALLPRIEAHGTVLCLAPLGPQSADFCGPARECRLLVDYMDHPSLGLHLSSATQVENADCGHAPFSVVRGRLDHFHANEPGLAPLGSSGLVDHADFRRHLAAINYRNWVVMKQRIAPDPLTGLEQSARSLSDWYLRLDNLSLYQRQAAQAKLMGAAS